MPYSALDAMHRLVGLHTRDAIAFYHAMLRRTRLLCAMASRSLCVCPPVCLSLTLVYADHKVFAKFCDTTISMVSGQWRFFVLVSCARLS